MAVSDRLLFTDVCASVNECTLKGNSVYVAGASTEDRGAHIAQWESRCSDVTFVHVTRTSVSDCEITIRGVSSQCALRSQRALRALIEGFGACSCLYLDITTLEPRVWAPMLKIAHLLKRYIIAVYVEPFAYRASSAPTGEVIYDLSKATDGISPIPGFINLVDAKAECACFVPVLGFEGGRFAHMIEKVQPLEKGIPIVPIIGVPGFRPEYPFTAYLGNRKPLKDTQSWRHVRLATANCPFSLFRCLEDIHRTRARHVLQVAPIGTKPHVLGAIMYALAHPDTVEVIYDHPTRRPEGTRGTARVLGYHVSPLMSLYSVAAS